MNRQHREFGCSKEPWTKRRDYVTSEEILRDVVGGSPANAKALLPTGCFAKVRFRINQFILRYVPIDWVFTGTIVNVRKAKNISRELL